MATRGVAVGWWWGSQSRRGRTQHRRLCRQPPPAERLRSDRRKTPRRSRHWGGTRTLISRWKHLACTHRHRHARTHTQTHERWQESAFARSSLGQRVRRNAPEPPPNTCTRHSAHTRTRRRAKRSVDVHSPPTCTECVRVSVCHVHFNRDK